MAALVQSFPQQSSTVTMLQTRPSSASGPFQTAGQAQQHIRNSQMPRNIYNINTGNTSYRGHTPISPIAPYAFTTTPVLSGNANPLRQNPTTPHLRLENRTSSAPVLPYSQQTTIDSSSNQVRQSNQPAYPLPSANLGTLASAPTPNVQSFAKDDSMIAQRTTLSIPRPLSSIELNSTDLSSSGSAATVKPSPDRYRRNHRRAETNVPATTGQTSGGSALPSGSGMATVGHLYNPPANSPVVPQKLNTGSQSTPRQDGAHHQSPQLRPVSKDDMGLPSSSSELAKRYRRRSVGSIDAGDGTGRSVDQQEQKPTVSLPKSYASVVSSPYIPDAKEKRPSPVHSRESSHGRNGSDDSINSIQTSSRPSSVRLHCKTNKLDFQKHMCIGANT